jgi:hypothetical protein
MTEQSGFPSRVEYNTAIVNYKATFKYPMLRDAAPLRASNGTYIIGGGAYAVVSKITVGQEQWALRLPTAKQNGADARYKAIAAEVAAGSDLFVKVVYAPDGIEAPAGSGLIRPVVLMEWVNGAVVRDFVIESCEKKDIRALESLRDAFVKLARNMHQNGVSHGDLSPDNIIVDQTGDEIRLQLVDYDSVQIEKTGPLPSSVPLTPMRHPGGPTIADLHSDALPFLIYFGVLTALIDNPELGKNPDNYDQKFLIDSQIARNGLEDEMMRQLHTEAPEEIDRIIEALKNPYDQTPKIFEEAVIEVKPENAIMASDWMEIYRHVNDTVTINGFVKDILGKNKYLLSRDGVLNRGGRMTVVSLRAPKIPIRIGDEIYAIGKIRRTTNEYILDAERIDRKIDGQETNSTYSNLRTRINDALIRIKSQRY